MHGYNPIALFPDREIRSSLSVTIKKHFVSGVVVQQSITKAIHCINPDCPRPYPQPWSNRFCNGCGAALHLNDRYIPLQRLGSGGFAAIYTVWDTQKKTERVLKVLLETAPKALELFEQEAAVLKRLKHPGIPRVEKDSYFVASLGHPQQRSLPCLVMEKIDGQTLEDVLDRYPRGCPEAWAIDWLEQAVEILRELHRCGIIHRDLKPSNLMLREETGRLVTIDFGGAKQIGSMRLGAKGVSTRLISPGYSPPEQITGERIGPPADFYALGRTMIQLLTGQDLADLEDPDTGELRWRGQATVSSTLADLLDEMVRLDPQQRPATAVEIQRRLTAIAAPKRKSPPTPSASASFSKTLTKAVNTGFQGLENAIAALGRGIATIWRFLYRLVIGILFACLDTTREMTLGGIGAGMGAAAGFMLINWTRAGDLFAAWVSQQLPLIIPDFAQVTAWREILMFAIAGFCTAWGLTQAGGYGQERRPGIAGVMGMLGYGAGWLIWQLSIAEAPGERLLGAIGAVAVFPLVLGLGLPSHYFVHALVAAAGTGTVLGGLVWLRFLPLDVLLDIFSRSDASWFDFINSVAFFCLWGVAMGFWLGVSYYLVVPVLRWLGWR